MKPKASTLIKEWNRGYPPLCHFGFIGRLCKRFVDLSVKVYFDKSIESEQSGKIGKMPWVFCDFLEVTEKSMVIRAVHIWIYKAFCEVPRKLLMWRFCLRFLKKISISHLERYSRAMVLATWIKSLVWSYHITMWVNNGYTANFSRVFIRCLYSRELPSSSIMMFWARLSGSSRSLILSYLFPEPQKGHPLISQRFKSSVSL